MSDPVDLFKIFQDIDDSEMKDLGVRENYVRAFFKYPGSKARCVKDIVPHLPVRDTYIEVFGGSAAVLLARQKSKLEVYNDRWAGVVAFFRCIQNQEKAEALVQKFEWCLHSREEFIFNRETWQNIGDDVERAARWLYIQHYSFAGIGKYFGRATTTPTPTVILVDKLREEWKPLHYRMKSVIVENQDWRPMMVDFDAPGAVFYLDPPYLNTAPQAYNEIMQSRDHIVMLERIFNMQAFVAVSSYENDVYNKFPWDQKIYLEKKTGHSMMPQGTNEQNKMQGQMSRETGTQEVLYIKD